MMCTHSYSLLLHSLTRMRPPLHNPPAPATEPQHYNLHLTNPLPKLWHPQPSRKRVSKKKVACQAGCSGGASVMHHCSSAAVVVVVTRSRALQWVPPPRLLRDNNGTWSSAMTSMADRKRELRRIREEQAAAIAARIAAEAERQRLAELAAMQPPPPPPPHCCWTQVMVPVALACRCFWLIVCCPCFTLCCAPRHGIGYGGRELATARRRRIREQRERERAEAEAEALRLKMLAMQGVLRCVVLCGVIKRWVAVFSLCKHAARLGTQRNRWSLHARLGSCTTHSWRITL